MVQQTHDEEKPTKNTPKPERPPHEKTKGSGSEQPTRPPREGGRLPLPD
jgi:hypothetical protein